MVKTQTLAGAPIYWILAGTVAGWLAVNVLGLFQNARMKRQLQLILESKGEPTPDGPFVGFATPRFSSMIDPHEDVGYLRLAPDRLTISTETQTVELPRSQISKVRFRANVHSLLGLGRWVSVEGTIDGKRIRLLIEPRQRNTLFGNLRYSKEVAQSIKRWLRNP